MSLASAERAIRYLTVDVNLAARRIQETVSMLLRFSSGCRVEVALAASSSRWQPESTILDFDARVWQQVLSGFQRC